VKLYVLSHWLGPVVTHSLFLVKKSMSFNLSPGKPEYQKQNTFGWGNNASLMEDKFFEIRQRWFLAN